MEIRKKIVDDKIAVLVSPGFGAGWSTWNREHGQFLAFDSTLVDMAERGASSDEVEEYLKKTLGEDAYVYMGGWSDIEVEWLPVGTSFYIHEYDGSESTKTNEDLVWTA